MNSQIRIQLFIIVLIAVSFSAILSFYVYPYRSQFLNDTGNKLILIKHLSEGSPFCFGQDIPTRDNWVSTIWEKSGTIPFCEPFMIKIDGKYYVTQAPVFCWFASLLYRWLGWVGPRIWPLLGLLFLLIATIELSKYIGFDDKKLIPILLVVTLCTPIVLYGSLLWEHTIGDFLVVLGLLLFFSCIYL